MALTQGFVVDQCEDLQDTLSLAGELSFDFVELNMEAGFSRHRVAETNIEDAIAASSIDILVHLPYKLDIGSPHEHARRGACREVEACLDVAAEWGAEKAVVHADTAVRRKHWERSTVVTGLYESLNRLQTYASEQQIQLCAENLHNPFIDISDVPELLRETDAACCLDTGHAFVSGTSGEEQANLIREYNERISHVHLNDTRLTGNDEHLPVGLGQVAFEPIVRAMVEIDWTGTCTHEIYRVTDASEYIRVSKQQLDDLHTAVQGTER